MAFMHLYVSNVRCSCIQTQLSRIGSSRKPRRYQTPEPILEQNQNQAAGIHKRDNMPSADETQQMIEDEIAPINSQLDQLDYELDSRIVQI